MNVIELVKQVREYFDAAMGNGFTASEAMDLAKHYQSALLQNDLLERINNRGDKPWERQ